MATFAEICTTIADDLTRSDLTSQIQAAVIAAIHDVEANRFWFNETRNYTLATIASTSRYALSSVPPVADFVEIDYVQITVNGDVRQLVRRGDVDAIDEDVSDSNLLGEPIDWSYYGGSIILYPIPQAVYTVRIAGHFKVPELTTGTDTNIWLTAGQGYELIRSMAAARVAFRPIRDLDFASALNGVAQSELDRLRVETHRRTSTGVIRPNQW